MGCINSRLYFSENMTHHSPNNDPSTKYSLLFSYSFFVYFQGTKIDRRQFHENSNDAIKSVFNIFSSDLFLTYTFTTLIVA